MKFKAKYKASLTISFLFIFQTFSLMLFSYLINDFFIPNEFQKYFSEIKKIADSCPATLQSYNYANVLLDYSKSNNVQIQIIDQANHSLYDTGSIKTDMNNITQVKPGTIDGRPIIIKLDFKITSKLIPHWLRTAAIFFQIVIVVIMYLIVAAVIHSQFIKPIVQLSKRMGIQQSVSVRFKHFASCDTELLYLVDRYDELMNEISIEREKQNRIIASISHDIKSPLTSVMGYIERIQGGKADTPEKQQHYLNIIYRKSENIKNLVNEFDDYLSATTSVMQMKKQRVNLLSFLSSLYEDYKAEFDAIGACISLTTNSIASETMVNVDINRMHRVFGNIIGNAVKYAKNQLDVVINARVKNGFAIITLSDSGYGVDENEINKIFDPLYMADKARQSDRDGSGLGLSICKSIIEAHCGEITARNVLPHGFQVEITLPIILDI